MKHFLFAILLISLQERTSAQCIECTSDCDVRELPVVIELSVLNATLCRGYSLHNIVSFVPDFTGSDPHSFIFCNPGDGSPAFQLFDGVAAAPHTYSVAASNTSYTVIFEKRNESGQVLSSKTANLLIKGTSSVNNGGFTPPDLVIPLSTSATFTPPVPDAFPPGSPYNTDIVGGAHAYIKYAPAHNGKLLKPLIFVDGLDLNPTTYTYDGSVIRHGSTGWDIFMLGNDDLEPNPLDTFSSEFTYYPTALNTLMSSPNDYDIVFLDFGSGADYIEKNGLLLVELIKWVNQQKAANAQTGLTICDNAVVGASMGGQIAKWALSYMEEQNIPHQTHTYASFDSPHRGAHLPLSLQAFALLANRANVNPAMWESLNSPAARQMVMRHIGAGPSGAGVVLDYRKDVLCDALPGWQVPDDVSIEYPGTALMRASYNNTAATLGYPQMTRNVAISCGSSAGTPQGVPDGGILFEAGKNVGDNPIGGLCLPPGNTQLGYGFYAQMRAANGGPPGSKDVFHISVCQHQAYHYGNRTLFAGFIPKNLISFNETNIPCRYVYLNAINLIVNAPNFENASGCSRTDIIGLKKLMTDMGIDVMAALDKFTFMPNISTLDIDWPMDNDHLTMGFSLDELVSQGLTPFDAVYAEAENLRHVELTAGMVNWLIGQLEIGLAEANSGLNLTAGQTFNYGKRKNRVPNTVINTGAKLAVNMEGHINYMTPTDPLADKPHFAVYTGGGCSAGHTVTVENGGTLQIGDPTSAKTGIFHALETSTVHVKTGGILHIANSSTLSIYPGATLILDPGAIVHLESPESNVRIEGTLVWNGDIQFAGLGYFDFESGHTLELGPNADAFRLSGAGKENRFIRINGATTLYIPDGKGLDLEEGAVEHRGNEIQLGMASWCKLSSVKMYGDGVTGLLGDKVGNIIIEDCTFDGLTFPIDILGSDNAGFPFFPTTQVKNTDFHNYHVGAHFRGCGTVLFENSQFFGISGAYAQSGIFSEFNLVTIVRGCTINDHDAGVLDDSNNWADPLDAGDAAMGVRVEGGWLLWMDGGEINNCEIGIGNQVLDPANGAPTNIYMNHFATIRGCHSGIVMNGSATAGMVTMDCARILEIGEAGIYGEDITLVIDPLLINTQSGGTNPIDPNAFTRYAGGVQKNYIEVCYIDKTPAAPLPAKRNFWGSIWGGTIYPDGNPNQGIVLKRSVNGGVTCGNAFTADVSQALSFEPTGCARELGPWEPDDCAIAVFANEPTTVRQQFRAGLNLVLAEDFESARTTFGTVASLWQSTLPGYTYYCETLLEASKSLSEGESRGQASSKKFVASHLLYPNPASGEVTILLPAENCDVRILDIYGKLVYETTASGNVFKCDTSPWPSGLYWVDAHVGSDKTRIAMKLVVQR